MWGDRGLALVFASAMAAIVLCCLFQYFPAAGHTFWEIAWRQEAAGWAQAIGTVAAVIAAIAVATADRRARLRREQTVAAMRIASRLRSWLNPCASSLAELATWIDSNHASGSDRLAIPSLDIDLNDVALLPVARAKRIYSLMEQHARAIDEIRGNCEYATWDDGATTFQKEGAKLFRRARNHYREMAKELGLHVATCQAWELRVVNRAGRDGGVKGWNDLVGDKRQGA